MDNFRRYESLKSLGWDATAIYRAGGADGLDVITCIRMIRSVCKLSLKEAKLAVDPERGKWIEQPQSVAVGGLVSWDVSDSQGLALIREGRVLAIADGWATVELVKSYDIATGEAVPDPEAPATTALPIRHLEKSLLDRLEATGRFWMELAQKS